MTRLVVDPQTLRELQVALISTLARAQGEHGVALNALNRTLTTIDAAVTARRARVQQCEAALQRCRNSDRGDCSIESSALAEAQHRLDIALRARTRASQAGLEYESRARASLKRLESLQAEGKRYLALKLDRVAAVNADGTHNSGTIPTYTLAAGPGSAGGLGVHSLPGLPPAFMMVPVSLIDQNENPILGPADFMKGYSIEDLDYAFDLLESRVLPDLASGLGEASFAAADRANGSYGCRSLGDTFRGFFGNDAIRLELGAGGRYTITNGRHRIFVASLFGRPYVPARIVGGNA